jgi:glycerol-3-phosphate acyltransferase PlsY
VHILEVFIYALIGYLFGGILFSVIVGRIFLKIDIRTIGSNNAGATNLGRAAKGHKGLFLHITGALLDTLKGFVAILINAIIARYGFKTAGFWS